MSQEVKSLAEFMHWVESMRADLLEQECVFFYRGHSDASYRLEPGVYRRDQDGRSYREREHQLYEEMLRRSPAAFYEDQSLFERLVRMQHFELPTRLLDITASPLVALYFACLGKLGVDGEVMFFPRKREWVDYQSDVPDAAYAGIERAADFAFIASQTITHFLNFFVFRRAQLPKEGRHAFEDEFHGFLDQCIGSLQGVAENHDLVVTAAVLRAIETATAPFVNKWDHHFGGETKAAESSDQAHLAQQLNLFILRFYRDFNQLRDDLVGKICEQLRIRRHDGNGAVHSLLSQFTYFYFVHSPLNNERIRRQQGAFVIFPPGRTEHWSLEDAQQVHRVRIAAGSKELILRELAHLGITHSQLFPELHVQAADAKRLYQVTPDKHPRWENTE
ncbi:FRG domain-containing protein [Pseudoduganella sp. DS3]|uniref:FRG domain-containing protein n=1 Tax=Pseudoduganella guangdongensis TaxID=2692179 RepID=A0A6N9HN17_9BURK|nr:FRG domain-containing protein [Pseudoduganella guangdongensis]MYN04242.1 FRG domain-containing protein [Pseudoduganella guangdongensis]